MRALGARDAGIWRIAIVTGFLAASLAPAGAQASMFAGEMLDTVADYLAIFVLFLVPIGGVVLFWLVHILPEKVAEKRFHPQKDSIKTLCLLSLVFGGMLWPLAWLWAYTKPVAYRVAYGTDKGDDYFEEMAKKQRAGTLLREEVFHLREELEAMEARGALPPNLRTLKDELARLRLEEAKARVPAAAKPEKAA